MSITYTTTATLQTRAIAIRFEPDALVNRSPIQPFVGYAESESEKFKVMMSC